jgi:hypothetical protein
MKTNLNFTLANFRGQSAYRDYFSDCPCPSCSNERWTHEYETDLAVDGKVVGRAYTFHEYTGQPSAVNFTLDGTTWYSVTYYDGYENVKKSLGENGEASDVPTSNRGLLSDSERLANLERLSTAELLKMLISNLDNTEYDDVIKAYDHLEALVKAVAAKEPPKQS